MSLIDLMSFSALKVSAQKKARALRAEIALLKRKKEEHDPCEGSKLSWIVY
ncbi:MAG: hypothetical protein U1E02_42155 [Hydrogenophaga sp.]|nr:hypothetical protein [Hydrogenophaga sp.]